MGKPIAARSQSDVDALSLHTRPDSYDYDDLPSYTDSEVAATSSSAQQPLQISPTLVNHDAPQDDYAAVNNTSPNWLARVSKSTGNQAETSVRIDQRLADPYNLYVYIMDCVRMVPPKPMIRVNGHHWEHKTDHNNKKTKERVNDFDIKLSLERLLRAALTPEWWDESVVHNDNKAYRGGFRKTRAPGNTQGVQLSDEPIPTLKDWCEQYCASPARLKVFRVTREVRGIDTARLESLISDMIRSTEYRGRLEITFPVDNKYVDIYSPHVVNEWRNSWIRYVFYFSMLWILTWPILFLLTKWYATYVVIWNFSITNLDGERKFATMSERAWFDRHANYIKNLVLNRHNGEADMHPTIINDFNDRPAPARATSGNANLDTAISVARSGVNLWNQFSSGGHQPSSGAWGYDT